MTNDQPPMTLNKINSIGIIGSGAMGSGIAQVAAQAGEKVILFDSNSVVLEKAKTTIISSLEKLAEKGKISGDDAKNIFHRISFVATINDCKNCNLIIEAIVENLEIKQNVFSDLEKIVNENCVLASNTSSISITSIASACKNTERVIGIHFFNPATILPLVEIIPTANTDKELTGKIRALMERWKKIPVIAKDTPGFIVNRVARPFYGEALRIYEEGFADFATIDCAVKEFGGFKMGPFELMDFIGIDVNYSVTKSVWEQMFFDPKYKPSLTQKRLFEAAHFGRKTGKGFYDYSLPVPNPRRDRTLCKNICWRILVMLINEAADALYFGIATKEDLDSAMLKGVNYPKGLLQWADEKGIENCLQTMERLYAEYGEDRYRPSVQFRKMLREGTKRFY